MADARKDHAQATGSSTPAGRIVTIQFDRYSIKVKLGSSNEFLGIVEVGLPEDFRSVRQKIESRGSYDVSDLYDVEQ